MRNRLASVPMMLSMSIARSRLATAMIGSPMQSPIDFRIDVKNEVCAFVINKGTSCCVPTIKGILRSIEHKEYRCELSLSVTLF